MKKTLVSALTTVLAVGAASTAFAAANPFQDVPADHWAYDAVAQLAKDGVVEGYGDGTYVGEAAITRYEMAQMVAKAMTKSDLKHADKAMVDKLAAEFADELNQLGVRVAKLEKKVDNVKWDGELRYRYFHRNSEVNRRKTSNEYLLRLNINAEINEHWTGKARLDYQDTQGMKTAKNISGVKVDRLWVVGKYGDTVIELGKLPHITQFDYGASMSERIAGGKVTFGKDIKVAAAVGRFNFENSGMGAFDDNGFGAADKDFGGDETGSYQSLEIYNDRAQKFTWGVGYQHMKLGNDEGKAGNWNLYGIGLGYKFDKNVQVKGAFDKASGTGSRQTATGDKQLWFVEVDYKGAKREQKGSWGAYIAYRHVGDCAALYSTWRQDNSAWLDDFKGIDIGVNYTFFKNIMGTVKYFTGKTASSSSNPAEASVKNNAVFGQLDFFF